MIAQYGSVNGFGWKLNEVVAAQIVWLPGTKVIQKANQSFFRIVGLVCVVLAVMVVLLRKVL